MSILLSDNNHETDAARLCGAALDTASRIASLNLPDIRFNCDYYAKVLGRDFVGAQREAEEARDMARRQGNKRLEAAALQDVAYMAHARRNYSDALRVYKAAMTASSELRDEPWEGQETVLLYAWLLSDLGQHSDARRELEGVLKAYSTKDRQQKVAESLCFDFEHQILGPGTGEWLQMLKELADFTPNQCDETKKQVVPLEGLDLALLTRVEVEEPHC